MWEKTKGFVRRYNTFFVFVPALVGLHWVWYKIQFVDAFVQEHERQPFPLIVMYRELKKNFLGVEGEENTTVKNVAKSTTSSKS